MECNMKIETKNIGDIKIISIFGRLDATTASEAEQSIFSIIDDAGVKLLIDLSNLEYISSAGLRTLLLVAKNVSAKDGALCLCSLMGNVKSVFEISGFLQVFTVKEDEEEAVAYLKR